MDRRRFQASRMRNWLALLLMAIATFAAGHSQAAERTSAELHVPR
ncbi:hypothetical protein [Lysobacter terrae]